MTGSRYSDTAAEAKTIAEPVFLEFAPYPAQVPLLILPE